MPEITVIITTYNLESMIAQCLDELFAQTFQDFNILIVDDCSRDSTADIVRQYIVRHPGRIQAVFWDENLGSPGMVRNAAIDSGKIDGKYVVFLDGDDSVKPCFLEVLHDLASQTGAEISICAYERVERENGHVLCTEMRGFPATTRLPPIGDILAFINTSLWNKLILTSIIGETRVPHFKVGEDLCFLHRLYAKCEKIAFTDYLLIRYKVRKDSVISNTGLDAIKAFAAELASLYVDDNRTGYRDTTALTAFIHIGISMALRAADNPAIDLKEHLEWTRRYFKENFLFFKNCAFLRPSSLLRHGVKGLAIGVCLLLYRVRGFHAFISIYRIMTRLLRIDIKF